MAGLWIVGEDMPRAENRVTLHKDEKEAHGMPIADVHFDDHPNDTAMRNHAYKQATALYDAVGATRSFPTPPYPSTHNLGTNRMSEKAEDGVVNKHGQAHDIKNLFVSDGSQFTTGAAENPTLTIVSLAIRQAEYIASQIRKILRHPPVAGRRALVRPGELAEGTPLVIDEILVFVTRAGLEDDDIDAFLGEFVAERAAAGAGADDHDHAVVVEIK
ncbi:hypothetical protein X735_28970 [Mesorhizobium sp. L2C085B000]|nr:hypothetical protein X735_28970 [Mesorhizobium sp. L2C085B000]